LSLALVVTSCPIRALLRSFDDAHIRRGQRRGVVDTVA